MQDSQKFDALIVVTPSDCERLMLLYPRLIDNFRYGRLCFIGSTGVNEVLENNKEVGQKSFFVDENSLIHFDDVHSFMAEKLKDLLKGQDMPRSVTGWYYQQFLKMQYAYACDDEYYMVWDGDTIPCREIKMFEKETGKPYLDLKYELHQEYFDTLSIILPGFKKVIERSFISEHMLIKKDIMKEMIEKIEANDSLHGTRFWEKILDAIPAEKISTSSFSEFETYGTYVVVEHPDVYELRDWHSFRLGGQFFAIDSIADKDFKWLGKDFDAISFEKNQQMVGNGTEFFSNPYYQKRLSAKQMLQAIQMEYNGGYKEVWDDDPVTKKTANITTGGFANGKGVDNRTLIVIVADGDEKLLNMSIKGIEDSMSPVNYKIVTVQDVGGSFYASVNKAVKSLDGTEYDAWDIFVIKSGTRVVFDSIHFLKHAIYSSDEIGAAGCVSNLAGNNQQIETNCNTVQEYIKFGENNNILMEEPFEERVVLSSNGVMIRRDAYNAIGGFDESFGTQGRVGDIDYSVRLHQAGYRLLMVKNSFVYREVWNENEDIVSSKDRKILESKHGTDLIGKIMGDSNTETQEERCSYTTAVKNQMVDLFTAAEIRYVEAASQYHSAFDRKKLNDELAVCMGGLNSVAKRLEEIVMNHFVTYDIPLYYIICDQDLAEKMKVVLHRGLTLLVSLIKYLSGLMESEEIDLYDEESMNKWGELQLLLRFDVLAPPEEKVEGKANIENIYAQLDHLGEHNRDYFLLKHMWLNSSNCFLPRYEDSDIAIVMQGPVHTERNFSLHVLMRYRKIYPNAVIILSTWKGEVDNGFRFQADCLNILILENDQPDDGGPWNIKYQLISTQKGIELAEQIEGIKYVLKTRTDQTFLLPDFLILFKNILKTYPVSNHNLRERIVFPGGFHSMCTCPFRITDFFTFGRIEDIKNYYASSGEDGKLLATYSDISARDARFFDAAGRSQYDSYTEFSHWNLEKRKEVMAKLWNRIDPESYIASSFYEKTILKRKMTADDDILMHYWSFVKNCGVFVDTDDILLLWKKYRHQYIDLSSNMSDGNLTHSIWLQMYYDDRFRV